MTQEELLSQPAEAYMDAAQLSYFSAVLSQQRAELIGEMEQGLGELRDGSLREATDDAEHASREEQQQWRLRLLARHKQLLHKIDLAQQRISHGSYGWCEETGEPIGLRRLLLRPTAQLCIEAKEREEQRERHVLA